MKDMLTSRMRRILALSAMFSSVGSSGRHRGVSGRVAKSWVLL
jgi:hypothetical protein